jgi:hypothetical protein
MADPIVHITSGLPDAGTGNITTLGMTINAIASTTAGQSGPLVMGAVTTTPPTYTTAQTNPLSLTTAGLLRVDGSGVTQPISGSITVSGTTTVSGTVTANQGGAPWTMKPDGTAWAQTGTSANVNVTNASIPVTGTFWQATQPVSIAATVNTAATQSGTWTVQPGNTANTTPWLATINQGGNSAVVKAASTVPAATDPALVVTVSPNSAALGTAGSPSANVGTIQGISGGTPVPTLSVLTSANNGLTASRVVAAASTNGTSVKASAGEIASIDLFNVAAYAVYFKLYNKVSTPTVGSDTPVWTIPIPAGGGFSRDFIRGEYFSIGIAYAITKLQADSDTTALAAGDVTGRIKWV